MKAIGIIGGGQLGLMIAEEARRMGCKVNVLDPSADAPAFRLADEAIVAPFYDFEALMRLGSISDVLTYEFENIPAEILKVVGKEYYLPQGINALLDSQNRIREKEVARLSGLPIVKYRRVCSKADLKDAINNIGYPCVLKTATLGYDGHGQTLMRSEKDIPAAEALLEVPCVLEEFVEFDYECSVITIRSEEQCISFPIGKNIHKNGILDLTIAPAPELYHNLPLYERMSNACRHLMVENDYFGILTVELFVKGDKFYFNEMAPRPHNSGHFAIEGCSTNQFRELCHFLLGETLQSPKLLAPCVMKNILGKDLEVAKEMQQEPQKDIYVHIYGKKDVLPQRKMGHITFVAANHETFNKHWKDKFVK
ncbi:MAG: 5-(carboxyamino)imidazole ribonucleotide synthase [Candidatus Cryptobacteroides sp.]